MRHLAQYTASFKVLGIVLPNQVIWILDLKHTWCLRWMQISSQTMTILALENLGFSFLDNDGRKVHLVSGNNYPDVVHVSSIKRAPLNPYWIKPMLSTEKSLNICWSAEGLSIRRHTVHLVLLMYLIGFSHCSGNSSGQLHINMLQQYLHTRFEELRNTIVLPICMRTSNSFVTFINNTYFLEF